MNIKKISVLVGQKFEGPVLGPVGILLAILIVALPVMGLGNMAPELRVTNLIINPFSAQQMKEMATMTLKLIYQGVKDDNS